MANETSKIEPSKTRKRVLDPYTRIAEVLFGLIMVLTFTGSLSVADSGREDVKLMLIGALGCNIAWGVIDGLFYLMERLTSQGQGRRSLRSLREAAGMEQATEAIAGALPPVVAAALTPADYETMRRKLLEMPEPTKRVRLGKDDWLGALGVFFLVFITTFPVAIPFMFMTELDLAMRVSNGIAIAMLFITGFTFARVAEYRPWLTGFLMVLLGSGLVTATIALGG